MAEFAPLFSDLGNVLPKNTQPLTDRQTRDALISTTVGAAPGASTVASRGRVKHNSGIDGVNAGKVAIETVNPINRVSAAADVTQLKKVTTLKNASLAFPKDLSGNGGPAYTRA